MPRGKIPTLKMRAQQCHDRISGIFLEVRCGPMDGYSDLHVITKEGAGAIFKFDGFGRFVGAYPDEKGETFFPGDPDRPNTHRRIPAPPHEARPMSPPNRMLKLKRGDGSTVEVEITAAEADEYLRSAKIPDRFNK